MTTQASIESLKAVLADVSRFLTVSLKEESLSQHAEAERSKLVETLEKLFAENYHLTPNLADDGSCSSHKSPSISGSYEDSKCSSHGSEEDYDDHIPARTVKSLENPTKLGYLDFKKDNSLLSSWQKKRYIVLHKKVLYCFKKPSDSKQASAFVITGYEFRESIQNNKKKDCLFELVCPGKKSYQFMTESKEDLQGWQQAIQSTLVDGTLDEVTEDGDTYEPLPETVQSSNTPCEATSAVTDIQSEEDADSMYAEGVSEKPSATDTNKLGSVNSSNVVSPGPSPGSASKAGSKFFGKISGLLKKKETNVVAVEDTKPKMTDAIEEFEDDGEIYEEVAGADKAADTSFNSSTSQLSPQSPSSNPPSAKLTATQEADDLQAPLSPSLPPRLPAASQPPPLPGRENLQPRPPNIPVPPIPIPTLPTRSTAESLPPPLPERGDLHPRQPPNIPVPPVPTPQLKPMLDRSVSHPREEDYENLYFSAWSCLGTSDSELSFERGELIHVISRDLDPFSWWVGEVAGRIGLVPKGYLMPAYTEVY